jgi:hypothetical protein
MRAMEVQVTRVGRVAGSSVTLRSGLSKIELRRWYDERERTRTCEART